MLKKYIFSKLLDFFRNLSHYNNERRNYGGNIRNRTPRAVRFGEKSGGIRAGIAGNGQAAQETHNILQRMKELASESANGTYDNTTDRDALQLEFDQLNDELNQIADTDFNGRLALNGGTMADGTVATNNTTVAGKPLVRNNPVSDPASAETYMKQVTGGVDSAGNGSIIINGTSVEIEGGKGGATVGTTSYSVENFSKKADGSGWDTAGKVTATTVVAVNADTKKITLFGKSYKVKTEIVTQDDVDPWQDKYDTKLAELQTQTNVATGNNYTEAEAKTVLAGMAGYKDTDKPTIGTSVDLIDDNGKALTANDLKVVSIDDTTNPGALTIVENYKLGADGKIKDNDGAGATIGTLQLKNGVSVSDAFEHGRRNLTYANNITLQTGARSKDAVNFTFEYTTSGIGDLNADLDISARGLGTAQLSLVTAEKANEDIDHIDNAINKTSMVRATFGAMQNRLEHKIDNLTTTSTNLSEAESNIRDTDMANEMMNYTKYNILQQAAQSMLAQANQQPQSILQLLG